MFREVRMKKEKWFSCWKYVIIKKLIKKVEITELNYLKEKDEIPSARWISKFGSNLGRSDRWWLSEANKNTSGRLGKDEEKGETDRMNLRKIFKIVVTNRAKVGKLIRKKIAKA